MKLSRLLLSVGVVALSLGTGLTVFAEEPSPESTGTSSSQLAFAPVPINPAYGGDILRYLVSESDVILIGEVGKTLGVERSKTTTTYILEDGSILVPPPLDPVKLYEIAVDEVLESSVPESDIPDHIPLMRTFSDGGGGSIYAMSLKPLDQGERMMLFLDIRQGGPNQIRSYDTYYAVMFTEDAGIFRISGNKAYPRSSSLFWDNDVDFYNSTDDYFELGPLKRFISENRDTVYPSFSSSLVNNPAVSGQFDGFKDISVSSHLENIEELAELGVIRGCNPPLNTKFCPDKPLTRGEMATLLARILNLPETDRDMFTDDSGNPHEHNINSLAASRISQGCNTQHVRGSSFCPDRPLTRGELATFLARGLGLDEIGESLQRREVIYQGEPMFGDTDDSPHARNVNLIAKAGLTSGCGGSMGNFCPDRPVTRAETATFLMRAIDLQNGGNTGNIAVTP